VKYKHSDDNTFLSPEYLLKMRNCGDEDLDLVPNRQMKRVVGRENRRKEAIRAGYLKSLLASPESRVKNL